VTVSLEVTRCGPWIMIAILLMLPSLMSVIAVILHIDAA
jgi:hypothetical protein